jgi:hypothetical protein
MLDYVNLAETLDKVFCLKKAHLELKIKNEEFSNGENERMRVNFVGKQSKSWVEF